MLAIHLHLTLLAYVFLKFVTQRRDVAESLRYSRVVTFPARLHHCCVPQNSLL